MAATSTLSVWVLGTMEEGVTVKDFVDLVVEDSSKRGGRNAIWILTAHFGIVGLHVRQ